MEQILRKKKEEEVKSVVKELGSTELSHHVSLRSNSVCFLASGPHVKSEVHLSHVYLLHLAQVIHNFC